MRCFKARFWAASVPNFRICNRICPQRWRRPWH